MIKFITCRSLSDPYFKTLSTCSVLYFMDWRYKRQNMLSWSSLCNLMIQILANPDHFRCQKMLWIQPNRTELESKRLLWIYYNLVIQSPVGGQFFIFWRSWIYKIKPEYKSSYGHMFLFIYLFIGINEWDEREGAGDWWIFFLSKKEIAKLFYQMVATFYISMSGLWEFHFLSILINTWYNCV